MSPLSTSCFGNKRSLALLWSSEARSSMTPDEIDVVERLVPWLAPLDARPGEIHDAPDDILAFCLAQRDGLVLKPAFGAGGKGVVIGSEVTDEQWRDLVLGVDPSRYVVQRAIVAMPEAFPGDALGAKRAVARELRRVPHRPQFRRRVRVRCPRRRVQGDRRALKVRAWAACSSADPGSRRRSRRGRTRVREVNGGGERV